VQLIGRILKLQVQRWGMKVPNPEGSMHPRRFETSSLLEVPAMLLAPGGVRGLIPEQEPILDVHHVEHPATKNADGTNGVSIGFSSHYTAMRERFGPHLTDGQAGENILVSATQQIDEVTLASGLAIQTQDGLVRLERFVGAEPCVEFTRFALELGAADPSNVQVTEGLRFLRGGMRGFYATLAGASGVVRPGDSVFVPRD
jgi:hypothetical protein